MAVAQTDIKGRLVSHRSILGKLPTRIILPTDSLRSRAVSISLIPRFRTCRIIVSKAYRQLPDKITMGRRKTAAHRLGNNRIIVRCPIPARTVILRIECHLLLRATWNIWHRSMLPRTSAPRIARTAPWKPRRSLSDFVNSLTDNICLEPSEDTSVIKKN